MVNFKRENNFNTIEEGRKEHKSPENRGRKKLLNRQKITNTLSYKKRAVL